MSAERCDILLVDDDVECREMVRLLINTIRNDLVIHELGNVQDAVTYLCNETPRMIISDYEMGSRNGMEIFEFINDNQDSFGSIVTVLLSGSIIPTLTKSARRNNVKLCLCKPMQADIDWNKLQQEIMLL